MQIIHCTSAIEQPLQLALSEEHGMMTMTTTTSTAASEGVQDYDDDDSAAAPRTFIHAREFIPNLHDFCIQPDEAALDHLKNVVGELATTFIASCIASSYTYSAVSRYSCSSTSTKMSHTYWNRTSKNYPRNPFKPSNCHSRMNTHHFINLHPLVHPLPLTPSNYMLLISTGFQR